jgi:C4-dicarboxylate-specific signal transduction histidine kinase
MNTGALARHGVELVRDFEGQPLVNMDKHKVLQILVNLVRNAKYACSESGLPDRRVTLSVRSANGRAHIVVADNGVGIAPENLTRIFNHGFTTRAEGHGFGLHSGALAAREVGGTLSVHSDGVGRGAAFSLELPLYSAETADA